MSSFRKSNYFFKKKFSYYRRERDFQNGGEAVGMVKLTFFLWEINRKFFFLAWGIHILATRKNNFCHPGESQWAPGGLLARFRAKIGYFGANLQKNQNFLSF